MADVKVDVIGMGDLPLVADLYRQVFKPAREPEFFKRRFLGRYNPLILIASQDGREVGFFTGFELKPGIFFAWLLGVVPELRRQGIATQLFDAAEAWAAARSYDTVRFECQNNARSMIHLAVTGGYDIVGIRWDPGLGTNLIIFEKHIEESARGG